MGILGLAADERVVDVTFTKDTLSVTLRDGRTITVPLAWYPRLYNATPEQYEEAVEAAVTAFEVTRSLPAYERGSILRNISNGIRARREELGRCFDAEVVAQRRQKVPTVVGHNHPSAGRARNVGNMGVVNAPTRDRILRRTAEHWQSIGGGKVMNRQPREDLLLEQRDCIR